MLSEPTCFSRDCKHYLGVKNDGDETTERNYCEAYLDKIPDRITYGDDKHLTVASDQNNDIVFEKDND